MSNNAVFRLLFTDIYGTTIVYPSMREVAAWLSLWDDATRRELIRHEPDTLLTLGDPGSLDPLTKANILREFVVTISKDRSRGLDTPIYDMHRIADPQLGPAIRECWGLGASNAEVRDLLLQLIWTGKIDTCVDFAESVATDPEESSYRRIIAIRALVSCRRRTVVHRVWEDMINSPTSWPAKVIHGVVEDLFACILDVRGLVTLIEHIPEPNTTQFGGFEWHLPRIVEAINPESDPAVSLRNELASLIWRSRDQASDVHRMTGQYDHLVPALAKLCVRQLIATSTSPSQNLNRASVHCLSLRAQCYRY